MLLNHSSLIYSAIIFISGCCNNKWTPPPRPIIHRSWSEDVPLSASYQELLLSEVTLFPLAKSGLVSPSFKLAKDTQTRLIEVFYELKQQKSSFDVKCFLAVSRAPVPGDDGENNNLFELQVQVMKQKRCEGIPCIHIEHAVIGIVPESEIDAVKNRAWKRFKQETVVESLGRMRPGQSGCETVDSETALSKLEPEELIVFLKAYRAVILPDDDAKDPIESTYEFHSAVLEPVEQGDGGINSLDIKN